MKTKTSLTWLLETHPNIKSIVSEPFLESLLDLEVHLIRNAYRDGRVDHQEQKLTTSKEYFSEKFTQ